MDFHEPLYLAGQLRYLMALRGHATVRSLAYRAEITEVSLGRILREEQNPTISTVRQLAQALGVRPYELLMPPDHDIETPRPDLLAQLLRHAHQLNEPVLHALVTIAAAAITASAPEREREYCQQ